MTAKTAAKISRKPQLTSAVPAELIEEFELFAGNYKAKQRWLLVSAAIVALLEMPPNKRQERIAAIAIADTRPEGFADLVESLQPPESRLKLSSQNSRSPVAQPGSKTAAAG